MNANWTYFALCALLNRENARLREENRQLARELMETDSGVLAVIQELEKSCNELLLSDRKKTEIVEKLKKLNKEQFERLKLQEEALIQADKLASLGRLVAGVAHEINNPVTYIRANIELLQKYWKRIAEGAGIAENEELRPFVSKYEEILASMHKGTDRIMDIVNGLKYFARQEKSAREVFDLVHCVSEACKLVKNEFIKNKAQLIFEPPRRRVPVFGSSQQTEQIFVNLLLNALAALRDPGSQKDPKVEIRLCRAEAGRVKVTVADNGCGIPEKYLSKIFDPFFTTKQAAGGTGLGLSIVYGIVKDHGWRIDVKSREGVGTEFVLWVTEQGANPADSRKQTEG